MELTLIPYLRSNVFPDDVFNEFNNNGYDFDEEDYIVVISWEISTNMIFKKWLLETYGNVMKNHTAFAIKY